MSCIRAAPPAKFAGSTLDASDGMLKWTRNSTPESSTSPIRARRYCSRSIPSAGCSPSISSGTSRCARGIRVVREVLEKSIEELEGDAWGEPTYDSYVVTQSHLLRRKPLKDLSVENLRLLAGQEIGFPWVLELAIEQLERNPWAEGDLYEGDLLKNVSRVKSETWSSHPELRDRFGVIAERVRPRLLMEARSDPHGIEAGILRNLAREMGWPVPGFLWHFPDEFEGGDSMEIPEEYLASLDE
jgi:hypothetical protein